MNITFLKPLSLNTEMVENNVIPGNKIMHFLRCAHVTWMTL